MNIKKYINPTTEEKKAFDSFLNENEFFDVNIDSYPNKEIYYVAIINSEIVGVRKVLTSFQDYCENTKWYDRFKDYMNKENETYYLQALAVKKSYRNLGVGNNILEETMRNIPKNITVFGSLMDSNTLRKKYSENYGFIELEEKDKRILIKRK